MIKIDNVIQRIKIIDKITNIRFGRMFFPNEIRAYLIDHLGTEEQRLGCGNQRLRFVCFDRILPRNKRIQPDIRIEKCRTMNITYRHTIHP